MVLWRIVFGTSAYRRHDPFFCGPWHPERSRVEAWADWFRARGTPVVVQCNVE